MRNYHTAPNIWGFPKFFGRGGGVPFFGRGVPIIRSIVFWGLYWGTLILGNYHIGCPKKDHDFVNRSCPRGPPGSHPSSGIW